MACPVSLEGSAAVAKKGRTVDCCEAESWMTDRHLAPDPGAGYHTIPLTEVWKTGTIQALIGIGRGRKYEGESGGRSRRG